MADPGFVPLDPTRVAGQLDDYRPTELSSNPPDVRLRTVAIVLVGVLLIGGAAAFVRRAGA